MSKKKLICIILVCILAIGLIAAPLQQALFAENTPRQVSDYFYAQIYDAKDNVVSKYKVTLTGTYSRKSRAITSVECSLESGDLCETSWEIQDHTATVLISHPTEGFWEYSFMLNAKGVFTGY